MFHGMIATRDGDFYITEMGYPTRREAIERAQQLYTSPNDIGIVGVIETLSPTEKNACPTVIPAGMFLSPNVDKNF